MIALVSAVLVASVLGSLHCAGMCGAFLAIALADTGSTSAWRLQAAYHGGRLITYTVLGAVAGLIGATINLAGATAGLNRAAAGLAAATLIVFGTITLLRLWGAHVPRVPLPAWLRHAATAGHRAAMHLTPGRRAMAIGLMTTLLPCGWLYAFVLVAAGTGHPLFGAVSMAVFWVGTLPVMISLGVGLRTITGAAGRWMPAVTAIALIGMGVWSLAGRMSLLDRVAAVAPSLAAIDSSDSADARVRDAVAAPRPCCGGDEP